MAVAKGFSLFSTPRGPNKSTKKVKFGFVEVSGGFLEAPGANLRPTETILRQLGGILEAYGGHLEASGVSWGCLEHSPFGAQGLEYSKFSSTRTRVLEIFEYSDPSTRKIGVRDHHSDSLSSLCWSHRAPRTNRASHFGVHSGSF